MKNCIYGFIFSILVISTSVSASSDYREKLDEKLIQQYQLALDIKGSSNQRSALRDIAKKAIEQKKFHTAYKIAKSINGSSTKRSVLRDLAVRAAEEGDIDFAITVAKSISGNSTRDTTIKKIIALQ